LPEDCLRRRLPFTQRRSEFGRYAAARRQRRGQGKPETVACLGCTHRCSQTRRGKFTVRRKTIAKRLRKKLQEGATLRQRMHWSIPQPGAWRRSVLLGPYRSYGVPHNDRLLTVVRETVRRSWCRTLRRRSQRHWLTWQRLDALAARWRPTPRICHPVSCATPVRYNPRQEPGAVGPHAGNGAGGVGELASLPRPS
jgi:hypothetical protein